MHPHLIRVLLALARTLGLAGVFGFALLDSSLLFALPGLNDLVLISFVIAKNDWLWGVAAALLATLGSVLGARLTYNVGRRGGGSWLRSRLSGSWQRRILHWTERYGSLPVGMAAVMPPPCPYAPFVISAGILSIPKRRFSLSIALGRGARYLIEAWLAMAFGRRLLRHWQGDYLAAFKIFALALGFLVFGWLLYRLVFNHQFQSQPECETLPPDAVNTAADNAAAGEAVAADLKKTPSNGI